VSVAILFFLVPIGAIVAWWLSQQRLMAKPWLEVGAIGEGPRPRGRGPCIQPPDAVGGRFRRYLSRVADLRRAKSK
jgi:cytochrome c oxidase subunit III